MSYILKSTKLLSLNTTTKNFKIRFGEKRHSFSYFIELATLAHVVGQGFFVQKNKDACIAIRIFVSYLIFVFPIRRLSSQILRHKIQSNADRGSP